jgi:hypothetical protein
MEFIYNILMLFMKYFKHFNFIASVEVIMASVELTAFFIRLTSASGRLLFISEVGKSHRP